MASYGDLQFVTTSNDTAIRGLAWPMKITNTGGWCSANYNLQAVKDGLIQLLLTQMGERPMRPDFGTNLRSSVFGSLDSVTVDNLKSSIASAISKYAPSVVVKTFDVVPDIDLSRIDISLVFSMKENIFTTQGLNLIITSEGIKIND